MLELVAAERDGVAESYIAAVLPAIGMPLWSRVIAEKRATISCSPGIKERAALPAIPGVLFAGDYTDPEYPPTLEAAVRSGVRAADKIASKVAQ